MKKIFLWLRVKLSTVKRDSKPVPFDKARSIGILVNNPDFKFNEKLNTFVNNLKSEGKDVQVVCFLDKEVNRLYDFPYTEFRMKDINFLGGFKEEKINKFIKTRFDYLYSINISPFLPFENILSRSYSRVRVGNYYPGSDKFLDLMIDLNQKANLHDLIKKMNELIPKFNFHE